MDADAPRPTPVSPPPPAEPGGLRCPFCGQPESDRLRVEEKLVVIFPCMFSPTFDPHLPEEELGRALAGFAGKGPSYFQEQCDRLHYFVTKGAGAVLPEGGAHRPPHPPLDSEGEPD